VVVDGTHLIENVEMYSIKNSDKYGSSSASAGLSGGKPGPGGGKKGSGMNNVMAMAAQGEIPTSDDFFGIGTGSSTPNMMKN
jgi:hypothetical protein